MCLVCLDWCVLLYWPLSKSIAVLPSASFAPCLRKMHYNTRMRKNLSDINAANLRASAKTPALSWLVVLLSILVLLMALGVVIVLARLVMG